MKWLNAVWKNTKEKGAYYESKAEKYLVNQGLKPVTRNYWCKLGEIDLIMQDQDTLVFIEVKYRKDLGFGGAVEALTQSKLRKLKNAINHYLQQNQLQNLPLRVDFVAINGQNPYQFDWFKNVL